MMALRITVTRIVQEFDFAFAPGETGEAFDLDAKDTFVASLSPLMLTFTPRQREGSMHV
jgi:hypothetical protein